MPLDAGVRFGPYEVVAPLGAGGMGEVYRARDTKLNRDVALKVLPAAFHLDPDRLTRFQREAETLAALNHPHIAAIYGLEEANGSKALVMELVEGEDLSQRIARGPVPLDEALHYAEQIAEALAAAHDHGIIHRDLKPANIQVRSDGTIKILDFGLAKAVDSASGSGAASMSPTLSVHATHAGVILGTAAYMAPEQARGRTVDRRADIWAFGAVLYEMLTGKRAFGPAARTGLPRAASDNGGDDVSDTLVSVLRDEPDWISLPADVPVRVRQALQICLQKDPKKRVRDITAVRLAMEGAFETSAPPMPTLAPPFGRLRLRQVVPWIGLGLVAGVAAVATAVWMRPEPPAPLAHFIMSTPPDAAIMPGGQNGSIAIAPNGQRIAYRTTQGRPDNATSGVLFLRELGRPEATLIRGSESAGGAFFFSPDGESVAFFANSDLTLRRVSVHGGQPQTICKLEATTWRGGSWGSDDTIVFATATSRGLRRVPAGGGQPEVLTKVDSTKGETDHILPVVLPGNAGVVFTALYGSLERSRIVALSPSGAITELIAGGTNPQMAATGHLLFVSDTTLRAVPFNPSTLEVGRNPVPLIENVAVGGAGGASYSISNDGTLVYVDGQSAGLIGQRTMVWVDRNGKQEPINVPPRAYTYARLSPDGTRVALDARDQQNDIWIFDLARETLTRLTTDPGLNRGPAWSPDGTRVAFSAERDGVPESLYWQKADGSGQVERLSVGSRLEVSGDFSPDGKSLVFSSPISPPFDIGVLSLEGQRQEKMLLESTLFSEGNGSVSRDGRWLAYQSNESGRDEIYLAPFPDVTASKHQMSTQGGTRPLWSKDGRELFYYIAPDTIMSVAVTLGPVPSLGKPTVVVKGSYAVAVNAGRHYDVSPDGKRFLLLKDVAPAPTTPSRPSQLHFIQHWDEELKRIK